MSSWCLVLLLIEEDGQMHVGVVDVSACGNPTPEIKHFRERNEVPPLEIKKNAAHEFFKFFMSFSGR